MPLVKDKFIELAKIDYCTGCSACADICPTKSIRMSDEGKIFSYPLIDDETCISCGRCMKVCPSINKLEENTFNQLFFAAWNKDDAERSTSTSGGVGTAIAKTAISHGYAVCGVQFDVDFKVIHSFAKNEADLEHFKGSKYVQSETVGIFSLISEHLKGGGMVLFIGTPCQVEAVKRFVPSRLFDQLLTCEIICHGVNSPKVWLDFVMTLEEDNNAILNSYLFRSKSHGWQRSSGSPNLRVAYKFDNGKEIDVPAWKNQFHYWFSQHYILRPSCSHCIYRREKRRADLTIADFWGIQNVLPEADTFKGVSAVIVSSERGLGFIRSVEKLELLPVDEEKTKKVLRGFVENKTEVEQQAEIKKILLFEQEYVSNGYRAMVKKYPHHNGISMFIHKLKCKLGIQ